MKKLLLMCISLTGAVNAMNLHQSGAQPPEILARQERVPLTVQTEHKNYHSVDIVDGHSIADVEIQPHMNWKLCAQDTACFAVSLLFVYWIVALGKHSSD